VREEFKVALLEKLVAQTGRVEITTGTLVPWMEKEGASLRDLSKRANLPAERQQAADYSKRKKASTTPNAPAPSAAAARTTEERFTSKDAIKRANQRARAVDLTRFGT
jgi:pyruvate/2-oxoglutarate dehydrogenase complex dihydrolipoamide acyltransferase (E2) component